MVKGALKEKMEMRINFVSIIQEIWCGSQDGDGWIEGADTWIIQKEVPRGRFSHKAYISILPVEIAAWEYYQGAE